jgi:hypothetical protein
MFGGSFGHGDVLIWFFEIFLFVAWFWVLMSVTSDLFRDHEVSGAQKALWIAFVIFFPFLGVFVYLVVRGGGMQARAAKQARAMQAQFDSYVRSVAGNETPTDQIEKAKALLDAGAIDRAEFDRLKAKALQ